MKAGVGPAAAFLGGLLSFASPCILPMVPVYISMITGYTVGQLREGEFSTKRLVPPLFLFFLGFTVSFVLLGATATALGDFLSSNYVVFKRVVGLFLVLWGLMLAGLFRPSWFGKSFVVNRGGGGSPAGVFVMGVAFGLSWSPCVGAILVPILSMAALNKTVVSGVMLLFCYSAGIALPMAAVAVALTRFMSLFSVIQRNYRKIEVATGILIALFGAYLVVGGVV